MKNKTSETSSHKTTKCIIMSRVSPHDIVWAVRKDLGKCSSTRHSHQQPGKCQLFLFVFHYFLYCASSTYSVIRRLTLLYSENRENVGSVLPPLTLQSHGVGGMERFLRSLVSVSQRLCRQGRCKGNNKFGNDKELSEKSELFCCSIVTCVC